MKEEISDEECFSELKEAIKEYTDFKEQEGVPLELLTADKLSEEIKEKIGIDIFPEEIQNDILTLSQKITDYALELAKKSEEENVFTPYQPIAQRFISCMQREPSRQIFRDAFSGARDAYRYTSMGSKVFKPLAPFKLPVAVAGGIATAGAASAGWMYGCMRR